MPISTSQVTAILITRGNVDMSEIVDGLIFDNIVIWDNSCQAQPPEWWWRSKRRPVTWCGAEDAMTYSRTLAIKAADTEVIYSQDDDIIHTRENQRDILRTYKPGRLTGCMWAEWTDGAYAQGIPGGYDDLVFAGSGSIYDRDLPAKAAALYLDHYPLDDFFRLWADTIIGVIAPTGQLNLRFDALPCAVDPDRMCNLPDAVALKTEAIRRARLVRDGALVAA